MFKQFGVLFKQFGVMAIVVALINLAFWLGLIYGAFRIAQHFGGI